MKTRNFTKFVGACNSYPNSNGLNGSALLAAPLVCKDGAEYECIYWNSSSTNNAKMVASLGYIYATTTEVFYTAGPGTSLVVPGVGTTPPSIDDTNLDQSLEDMITPVANSFASAYGYSAAENKYYVTITRSFIYNGTEEIDVTEVGLFKVVQVKASTAESSHAPKCFLLDRTLLETPIHVIPGRAFTISVEIDIA